MREVIVFLCVEGVDDCMIIDGWIILCFNLLCDWFWNLFSGV